MIHSKGKDESLRNALIDRVEVLGKVKDLMVIPEIEMVTARQIADFYEVDKNTLDQCVYQHKHEIMLDGMKTMTTDEFMHLGKISAKEMRIWYARKNGRFSSRKRSPCAAVLAVRWIGVSRTTWCTSRSLRMMQWSCRLLNLSVRRKRG